jgi:hypothetical protein
MTLMLAIMMELEFCDFEHAHWNFAPFRHAK